MYVPQLHATLIRSPNKTGSPYHVHELTHRDFYDLNTLQEEWGNNFTVDEERNQIKWHYIKILRVEEEHPLSFFY
jgi:hypothetical protein